MPNSIRRQAAYLQECAGPMGRAEIVTDRKTNSVLHVQIRCNTCWEPDPESAFKVWRRFRVESPGPALRPALDAWREHLAGSDRQHVEQPTAKPEGNPRRV